MNTRERHLREALKRFEDAVKDYARIGAADPADFYEIEEHYIDTLRSLYTRLGLTAPRVKRQFKS